MALTMKDIVEDARTFVQQKQASFKEGMAGDAPSSYPGAEHDKKVDESAKAPHPEVKQDLPPGGTTAAGAEKAEKVEAGHSKDSTQPANASVTKEPAVTDDAMCEPKTGSAKLANDLLSSVRALQDTMQPKQAGEETANTDGSEEEKSEDTSEETTDSKEASAPAPEAAPAADDDKQAQADNPLELTQDVLAKIASVILSNEEGWNFVEQSLTKEAGAEAARETITTLQKQAEEIEKQAAYGQGQEDAEMLIQQMVQVKQAEDAQAIYEAGAADAAQALGVGQQDLQKLGQMMADESLAGLAGGEGAEGLEGLEGMPEEGGEEVVDDMGGMPEDEDISEEELMQALQELAAEGQIDEEDIAAIMEYITQAESATGAEEAPMEGEEGLPPEMPEAQEAPEEGLEVAAAANTLQQNILGAIGRVKAAKKQSA